MSKNFWDFSELNFIDVFKNAMRKTMSFDALGGPEFIAKVLTRPVPLNPAEVNAFFGSKSQEGDETLNKKLSKFVFMGRIERIHDAFLEDPCDLSTASDEDKQTVFDLIQQHTKFYSLADATEKPAIGDLVKVRLKEGDNGAWNLQSGEYVGVFENGVVATLEGALDGECQSASKLFNSPGAQFLGALTDAWTRTSAGYPRCEALTDSACGPKDDPTFSKCKTSIYPNLEQKATKFDTHSASDVMNAIKDSGQSTSVQKIMWAIINHEQPTFEFPANNPSGMQLDNEASFRGASEGDFDYQTCFRDNGGDQRIFAGFNTLERAMKAFGKIIASKQETKFKTLSGASVSDDAETMTWNYYRSWNTAFSPAELETLKTQGSVTRNGERITPTHSWQQSKTKFQSALTMWG